MEPLDQPAEIARRAMRCVEQRERDAWLALFADDALLEDPVGHVPPRRGAAEIASFWDTIVVALERVRFDVRRIHEAPREALAIATVTAQAQGGATATYDAALHYTLDDAGTIVALRAFWDLADVVAQFTGGAPAP